MQLFKPLLLASLLSVSCTYTINIKLLKGTHSIIPDTNYSPFRGLIFIEEDIAEQWYRLSPNYQIKIINTTLDEIQQHSEEYAENLDKIKNYATKMVTILQDIKNNGTEDLVMQMFHIAGEAFNVTQATNNPIRQLTPKHIGGICKILHESTIQSHLAQDPYYQQALITQIKTRQKLTDDDQKMGTPALLQQYKKFITDKDGNILPVILQTYLKTKLADYLLSLQLQKSSKSAFQKKDFNPFIDSLIKSLQECDPTNPDKMYADNTTQGILLGYMLAKSNDHLDLQEYFRGFLNNDSYTLPHDEYTNQELEQIAQTKPDLNNIDNFADYLCALVYKEKYMSALPKIVSNTSVAYQGNNFPDCVETMMRNLVNIITYDSQKQLLGQIPAGLTANKQLQTFYNSKLNANPAAVNDTDVHRSWLRLVENKEGCSYNRLLVRGTQNHIEVRGECDGVIPLDTINKKLPKKEVIIAGKTYTVFEHKINSKTYWLVPTDGDLDCFELMPTLSNVIILLDTMFNLNLPHPVQTLINRLSSESIANQAIKNDFVASYFGKICKKLKWTIEKETHEQIKLLNNLPDQSVMITIELPSGEMFDLELYDKAHGSININKETEFKDLITQDEFLKTNNANQAAIIASKAFRYYMDDNHATPILNSVSIKELDKFITVINKDDRLKLINYVLENQIDESIDSDYFSLLLASFSTESDTFYQSELFIFFTNQDSVQPIVLHILQILADLYYLENKLITGKALCFALEQNFSQAWDWVKLGMQDKDNHMREQVILLLMRFCWSGILKNFPEDSIDTILEWIHTDLQISDYTLQENCAWLLIELINYHYIDIQHANTARNLLAEIKKITFQEDSVVTPTKIDEATQSLDNPSSETTTIVAEHQMSTESDSDEEEATAA